MRIGLALTLCSLIALGGCQSARFGGPGPVASGGPVYTAPQVLEPTVAAPSGVVSSEPLPPPPGAGPTVADVPVMPSYPAPVEPLPTAPSARNRKGQTNDYRAYSDPASHSHRRK